MKLYVDGEEWKLETSSLDDAEQPGPPRREPLRIGGGGGPENRFHGRIDDVRDLRPGACRPAEAGMLATADAGHRDRRAGRRQSRTPGQADKIRDYFLEHALPAADRGRADSGCSTRGRSGTQFYDSLPTVMVMEEMPTPRETHLLIRGAYDAARREASRRRCPRFLLASCRRTIRRIGSGLARWLVDPSNPLHGARHGEPVLADATSAPASSRRSRTSARRASGRRIPSCSTGWRPSSSAPAGT